MKRRKLNNMLSILTVTLFLGVSATAFAGPGMGGGRGWGWGPGMGYGPGMMGYGQEMAGYGHGPMGYGPGRGYGFGMGRGFRGDGYTGNLSDEDLKKLGEQRSAFFEATKNLRNDLFEKRLELRSELAKQNPDTQKAEKLQKEISELRTQMDQKRINHVIEMKKINPDIGRGFAGRGPGGYGAGFGGRRCWR